jgi:hypothetical protein
MQHLSDEEGLAFPDVVSLSCDLHQHVTFVTE